MLGFSLSFGGYNYINPILCHYCLPFRDLTTRIFPPVINMEQIKPEYVQQENVDTGIELKAGSKTKAVYNVSGTYTTWVRTSDGVLTQAIGRTVRCHHGSTYPSMEQGIKTLVLSVEMSHDTGPS